MKVLFITHYGSLYGANKAMLSLILDLRKRYKVDPYIMCLTDGDIYEEARRLKIPIFRVRYYRWVSSVDTGNTLKKIVKRVINFFNFPFICRLAKQIKPDIIHTNSSVT